MSAKGIDMATTAPIPAVATPGPAPRIARNRDENVAETPTVRRRGVGKRRTAKGAETGVAARYFLTKAGSNGRPELESELEDENQAMIEALKRDVTFVIVTEWRPKVDASVKGRPVIEKDPVPRGA